MSRTPGRRKPKPPPPNPVITDEIAPKLAAALAEGLPPGTGMSQEERERLRRELDARQEPLPDLAAIEAELSRRDLGHFCAGAWPFVEPARPLLYNWHVDAVLQHLAAVSRGQIKRLLINVPPGSGKSTLSAVIWPAWIWAFYPPFRMISASYAHSLAVRDTIKMRTLIGSDWYQQSFGDWQITQDRQDYLENSAGGRRQATSVGGAATGFRADCLLIDDASPAQAAWSKLMREDAWRWFGTVMSSRLDDPQNASIVVVGQRLATDDLPGRLLHEDGSSWECLVLPSEYDPSRRRVTCLGWGDPRTEAGAPLFPELYPTSVLEQARKDMGGVQFAAQHNQTPVADGGNVFDARWWRYHGVTSPRPPGCWDDLPRSLPGAGSRTGHQHDCARGRHPRGSGPRRPQGVQAQREGASDGRGLEADGRGARRDGSRVAMTAE